MYGILLTLFILICVFQMIAILLQSSKGGGLAGAFGGGGMGAVFGGRGAATFLSKLTAILAALFMLLALVLGIMETSSSGSSDSLVARARQEEKVASPAANLPSIPATGPTTPAPQSPAPSK